MTLATALQDYQQQFRSNVSKDIQQVMGQATDDLALSGIIDSTLKVGDLIPNFTLPNATGESVNIQSLLHQGPVVLAFYRGGWCPYCNLELKALQNALSTIQDAGATLVAISPETPDNSLTTQEKNELAFPVLSDINKNVLIINAHEAYPVSEGKLNATLVEKAKTNLIEKGYAVKITTMKDGYDVEQELAKHLEAHLDRHFRD